MIRKALIYSLLFVAGYCIVIMLFRPNTQIAQHQWQSNFIKAQNFIYNKESDTVHNVIIGSSLSCRLVMDSLKDYYNLSFSGQSIYDGLNILSHKNKFPKNIFIETNIVFRKEDENFIASLSNPVLYNTRLFIPSLRDGKQPLAIIGEKCSFLVGGLLSRLKPATPANADGLQTASQNNDLFEKILKRETENYSVAPPEKLVKESFDRLAAYLEPMQKKGVNIVFFEMPVNYNLIDLAESVSVRKNFYKKFPPGQYSYIEVPDNSHYKTTDGLHLNSEEAIQYTTYFQQAAKRFCRQ